METKLSRFATGVMEAAWLIALVLVPLFFDVYSSRIFEPDKITLLRSVALLILAAWVVKIVEEGGFHWDRVRLEAPGWRGLLRIPMVAPVLALIGVYLIATAFSLIPSVSFWGSYQRLQGTYTTFSYLVIFAAILVNLRKQAQVERLISAVILVSLPISIYGILQRYHLDPIPWGGDVVTRVSGNMGNAIFLGAFIILAIPFTWLRVYQAFKDILSEREGVGLHALRAASYVFIAALQLIGLVFTGSRGPQLGFGAGLVVMVVYFMFYKRWRTGLLVSIAAILLLGVFPLILLNIPNGPLESLRSNPALNRMGRLLEAESDTERVRVLIWGGAAKLVSPHPPIQYPDGRPDPFNAIRPLIGYGPESMYVAYNRFYPPELANIEKRDASPDRSHNETWDSLVTTGVLGFVVYLVLFSSVFYYALKWMGMIASRSQRNLFLILLSGGGVLGAVVMVALRGAGYFGLGLPLGMIFGVIAYITGIALFGRFDPPQGELDESRALIMGAILAALIGHFAEINFGIAIAVSNTYFWAFTGLLVVLGYVFPRYAENWSAAASVAVSAGRDAALQPALAGPRGEIQPESRAFSRAGARASALADARSSDRSDRQPAQARNQRAGSQKKGSRSSRPTGRSGSRAAAFAGPDWLPDALFNGALLAVILITLTFNYVTNAMGGKSAIGVLWTSLTRLKATDTGVTSGILALVLITWLVSAVALASEDAAKLGSRIWSRSLVVVLSASFVLALVYSLWHASNLAAMLTSTAATIDDVLVEVGKYEGLLFKYYVYLLLLVLAAGAFRVMRNWPARTYQAGLAGAIAAPSALIVALLLASFTNVRVVQADIAFKLADPFARPNQWPVAISIYQHANDLAPKEDYYYLFLGRAYLEYAKTLQDANQREQTIALANRDLIKAQSLSPLNTDHTANLARLYSLWASTTTDAKLRTQRAQISNTYFAETVSLSPNNAKDWDEWALLYMNLLPNPQEAFTRLQHSLQIDPKYDWTYGLLGDYYSNAAAQNAGDPAAKQDNLKKAAENYTQALQLSKVSTYANALGGVYTQLNQPQAAIDAYQQTIKLSPSDPNIWQVYETLSQLYLTIGDVGNARQYAQSALSAAPQDQKARLQALVAQIGK
ncbi:MAG TPA: O-antigen ligase family protein [Anaerolineales bacterium]